MKSAIVDIYPKVEEFSASAITQNRPLIIT